VRPARLAAVAKVEVAVQIVSYRRRNASTTRLLAGDARLLASASRVRVWFIQALYLIHHPPTISQCIIITELQHWRTFGGGGMASRLSCSAACTRRRNFICHIARVSRWLPLSSAPVPRARTNVLKDLAYVLARLGRGLEELHLLAQGQRLRLLLEHLARAAEVGLVAGQHDQRVGRHLPQLLDVFACAIQRVLSSERAIDRDQRCCTIVRVCRESGECLLRSRGETYRDRNVVHDNGAVGSTKVHWRQAPIPYSSTHPQPHHNHHHRTVKEERQRQWQG